MSDSPRAAAEESGDKALSGEELEQALLDWAECMRGQGVDIADPKVDSDGNVTIGGPGRGPGGDDGEGQDGPPDFEAIQAAREKCGQPPVGAFGGDGGRPDLEELQESALKLAECMRDEGITDFPDPDFSQLGPGNGPNTNESEGGEVRATGPFGDVDLDDPEVEAAMETCQKKLGDEGFGPPGRGVVRRGGGEGS